MSKIDSGVRCRCDGASACVNDFYIEQSQYPSCENLLVELENNLQQKQKARSRCIE